MMKTDQQIFIQTLKEKYPSMIIGIFTVFLFSFFILQKINMKNSSAHESQKNLNINSQNNSADKQSSSSGEIDMQAATTSQVTITADTYTVQPGDTLSIIAQKAYGDMYMWEIIANANNIVDINNIEEGTVLKIPRN